MFILCVHLFWSCFQLILKIPRSSTFTVQKDTFNCWLMATNFSGIIAEKTHNHSTVYTTNRWSKWLAIYSVLFSHPLNCEMLMEILCMHLCTIDRCPALVRTYSNSDKLHIINIQHNHQADECQLSKQYQSKQAIWRCVQNTGG